MWKSRRSCAFQRDAGWCEASGWAVENHHGVAAFNSQDSKCGRVLPLLSQSVLALEVHSAQRDEEEWYRGRMNVYSALSSLCLLAGDGGAFYFANHQEALSWKRRTGNS